MYALSIIVEKTLSASTKNGRKNSSSDGWGLFAVMEFPLEA